MVVNDSVPKKDINVKLSFQLVPTDDWGDFFYFLFLESSNDSQTKIASGIKNIIYPARYFKSRSQDSALGHLSNLCCCCCC